MTMRRPSPFIASSVCVVTGLASVMWCRDQSIELGQLALPEVAPRQLGMGDREARLVDGLCAEADDVEVERARPPPHTLSPLPTPFRFDGLALREQLGRGQRRKQQQHLIEEPRLGYRS